MARPQDIAAAQQQLAQWLEQEHPDIYGVAAGEYFRRKNLPHAGGHPLAGLGSLGDDEDFIQPIDFNPDSVDIGLDEMSAVDSASALQDLDFSVGGSATGISAPNVVTNPSSGSSGGILSTLKSIGSWIASPQGAQTIGSVVTAAATTYVAVQQANVQKAVIQAQIARANSGLPPAPITYDNGVPVYNTNTGQSIPPALLAAIQNGTAHEVVLADGSIGYTMDPPTLGSVLGTGNSSLLIMVVVGALVLLAVTQEHSK